MTEAAACKCGADKFDPPKRKCATLDKHSCLDGYEWRWDRDEEVYRQRPSKASRQEAFDGLIDTRRLPRPADPVVTGKIAFEGQRRVSIQAVVNRLEADDE
jgi:hypothetical protein